MPDNPQLLVRSNFILEKYPGKGGWTYVTIPGIHPRNRSKFGWVRVKGSIDSFQLKAYKLMPMRGGCLFLPVRADIRKQIGKKEGDEVEVTLYLDNDPIEIPPDLLLCLQEEPELHRKFLIYPESEQKAFIDWIQEARADLTKVNRIAETLRKTALGLRFRDKL